MTIKPLPENQLPEYMNYYQTCQFLNIGSYNLLYKFIAKGLKVTVVGGSKRISKTDARKFMEDNAKSQVAR
ncbi:DNA-binding protein [Fructilactobacillus hinvesii]|uniref:DNA-binding protein n=1 Tax=Fructilactobacillus hinvesii TaxID=2940300 RepID=A0ABY5BRH9_9LACO|nr:DNA-binding protein [Fructilactobacillus hinvesii]USS87728.1 DNA-binding protein [Fructilactobacillus hinvesii]